MKNCSICKQEKPDEELQRCASMIIQPPRQIKAEDVDKEWEAMLNGTEPQRHPPVYLGTNVYICKTHQ